MVIGIDQTWPYPEKVVFSKRFPKQNKDKGMLSSEKMPKLWACVAKELHQSSQI